MTSKRGEIPSYLVYLILGVILIFAISVFFIGKPIPTTFKEFQSLEKELTQQVKTFKEGKPTEPQTVEDREFLKTYTYFIQNISACMSSSQDVCLCELTAFTKTSPDYHISLVKDPRAGYYAYAYVKRDDKTLLLQDTFLGPDFSSEQGFFAYFLTPNSLFPIPWADFYFDQRGRFRIIIPSYEGATLILLKPRQGSSKPDEIYAYSYQPNEIPFFLKTKDKEIRFIPTSSIYSAPQGNKKYLSELPLCI